MRTLKLTLAYDGTNYAGWQRQPNGMSVQQVVEEALAPLVGGTPPSIAGAGRTDAGVHALGQVASVVVDFGYPCQAVQRALNVRLPADVRTMDVSDAPLGFHARFRAVSKTYRYRLVTASVLSPFERWFVWHAPGSYDLEAMRDAAHALIGKHDFAAFQATGAMVSTTVRTLHRLDVRALDGEIILECEGDGFLRHMVRTIAGTLAEVGTGARPVESVARLVVSGDRQSVGRTAPAAGLTLVSVAY